MWLAAAVLCLGSVRGDVTVAELGQKYPTLSSYLSMVLGSQSFNLTAPGVLVGTDDRERLCGGSANTTTVAARLPGAVAVVLLPSAFNRSCLMATQALALDRAGCAGALFVYTESAVQIVATLWSVATGANVTALPLLIVPSFVLSDALCLNSSEVLLFQQSVLGPSISVTMSGRESDWQVVSNSYGVVFQVTFAAWAAADVALAVVSLWRSAHEEQDPLAGREKATLTLASFCLLTEALGNAVRFVWFVVDPVLMRGTFPGELNLFFAQGLVSLTLLSVILTVLFWAKVLRTGMSGKPVTLASLAPWVVGCAVVLILLEFLDGILFLAAGGSSGSNALFEGIVFSVFAAVCLGVAVFLLFSGTFLLRRVRMGEKLKSEASAGRSRFAQSIGVFVLTELSSCVVLSVWFVVAAWVGQQGLLYHNNISYWTLQTVFYAALQLASTAVIAVYYRRPKQADLPPVPPSSHSHSLSPDEHDTEPPSDTMSVATEAVELSTPAASPPPALLEQEEEEEVHEGVIVL